MYVHYLVIIEQKCLKVILGLFSFSAKPMSDVLRVRNGSTGSKHRKQFRPGSGPLHVNMVNVHDT